MSSPAGNPNRSDPYKNFQFRVKLADRYVAGVSGVSSGKRGALPILHPAAVDLSIPHPPAPRLRHEPVILQRGLTCDEEFTRWISGPAVGESGLSAASLRKDLTVERVDEAGRLTRLCRLFRAWVSECQVMPSHGDHAGFVVIEHVKLEHDGYERDRPSVEPSAGHHGP